MSTIDLTPTCIWPVAAELGEGPIWMGDPGRVWFVDILGRQVHCCSEQGLHRQSWPMPLPVGFVLPLAGGKGDFVVGLKGHLQRFNPVSGLLTHLLDVEPEIPTNRINDGHVDAQGRLWFGTMDMRASKPTGQLYRLSRLMERAWEKIVEPKVHATFFPPRA